MEGKICTKCKQWKPLEEYHKRKDSKDGRKSQCKECRNGQNRQWREDNPNYDKEWKEQNKEHKKAYKKQWYKDNIASIKAYKKQWYQNNKEHRKVYDKQKYENSKETNLQYIFSIIEQARPIFSQLNLPVYGYIYKFENIKTGHRYLGQTIRPLKERYETEIVKGWIKEKKEISIQKFKDELIEENFTVEIIDIGICKYHLDKLEAYYIDKYDSYNNGYNNNAGYHNTDDGIEEFNQILKQHNLQFINGQLLRMEA